MEEKQERLFTAAHDLFLTQGFKHTSIAEIAARADVAVGTFYNFYPSKAAIFIQVYNAENERTKAEILAAVDLDAAPADLVKAIIHQIFIQSANNQILQEWFTNPQLNAKIAETNQNAVEDSLVYATLMKLIDRWQQRDLLKDGLEKDRIISLFNALTVVDFHQSEIQTASYYQLLNDLIAGILLFILK
ncbi:MULTISPECIES: TetR/AcrR family transcriptional regulator [Lactobacillaceae]|uniref:TetR/AcrR family transcriptional regulator n=1 Tax=Lactobacillaceae TaxID=33958 RepID=UPI00145784C2|nr:TetR/AcrR family transcriptional regulator [Lactobacillus sp. HBUAS51381]NLR09713.1 TetR/AcrR family transcriptional regulator [Lactobacillus sp. HBUAS51381]